MMFIFVLTDGVGSVPQTPSMNIATPASVLSDYVLVGATGADGVPGLPGSKGLKGEQGDVRIITSPRQ